MSNQTEYGYTPHEFDYEHLEFNTNDYTTPRLLTNDFMDLIDIALDTKDIPWASDLFKRMQKVRTKGR